MAEFTSGLVEVVAELTNGLTVECETQLKASGKYWEEWMDGWFEADYEIDEETIEAFGQIVLDDENLAIGDDVKIKRIVDIAEMPEWEVEEGWNKPDEDLEYERWRDSQLEYERL